MYVYRIQINELNNGEKRYIPQKGYLVTTRGWIRKQYMEWENILEEPQYGSFNTSKTMIHSYSAEKDAIKIIEEYKKYFSIKESHKIKKTTYKIIE